MGARWYDPALARWLSADTLVPEPGNPQAFNRYSWVLGNPLRYVDPSGHLGDDQIIQLLGENAHMLEWWKTYDYYYYLVLQAIQVGDTLYASDLPGAGLMFGQDTEGNISLIATEGASTSLINWQGKGGYSIRRLGDNDEAMIKRSEELFRMASGGFPNGVYQPVVNYYYTYRLEPNITAVREIGLTSTYEGAFADPMAWMGFAGAPTAADVIFDVVEGASLMEAILPGGVAFCTAPYSAFAFLGSEIYRGATASRTPVWLSGPYGPETFIHDEGSMIDLLVTQSEAAEKALGPW